MQEKFKNLLWPRNTQTNQLLEITYGKTPCCPQKDATRVAFLLFSFLFFLRVYCRFFWASQKWNQKDRFGLLQGNSPNKLWSLVLAALGGWKQYDCPYGYSYSCILGKQYFVSLQKWNWNFPWYWFTLLRQAFGRPLWPPPTLLGAQLGLLWLIKFKKKGQLKWGLRWEVAWLTAVWSCPAKELGHESVRKGLATLFLYSQWYSTISLG